MKRDADIEDPETRKSPSSLYLLPSRYVCVCVCAGVAVHQEEDEHRACVHSDRYLRFKAIICKFCLLFIRFQ